MTDEQLLGRLARLSGLQGRVQRRDIVQAAVDTLEKTKAASAPREEQVLGLEWLWSDLCM